MGYAEWLLNNSIAPAVHKGNAMRHIIESAVAKVSRGGWSKDQAIEWMKSEAEKENFGFMEKVELIDQFNWSIV